MDTKHSRRRATFAVLDNIPDGAEFFGPQVAKTVQLDGYPRFPMDGTVTRYIRHYSDRRRRVVRIGPKEHSHYRMGGYLC